MSAFMLYWQTNWQLGMTICCLLFGIYYIVTSILVLLATRRVGGDICCTAFIPFIRIIQVKRYKSIHRKKLKDFRLSQKIKEIEDEVIEL